MTVIFAHMSDTHCDGGARNAARAAQVMDYLDGLPIDAVVLTGDVVDHGLAGEYEQARVALRSRHPVLACPGNHDDRSGFRSALLDEPPTGAPINRVERVNGVTFALCDSTIPGRDDGLLADETLVWLDAVLRATRDPVFVCLHHPPVVLHTPIIDALMLRNADRLAAVLERHPHVVAVLCGHAHGAAASTLAGRPVLVAPGVVSTIMLPWEQRGHLDHERPPGIAFHVLDDDGRLTTHFRTLEV